VLSWASLGVIIIFLTVLTGIFLKMKDVRV